MLLLVIKIFLLSCIFLTPLLQARHPFGYEQIKVIFFMSVTTLCIAIALFHVWRKSNTVLRFTFDKKALLFVAILFIASLFGINPVASIFGIPSYYQGAILYLFLFTFYILAKLIKLSIKDYSLVLCSSSLFVAFDAILEWVQLHVFHLLIPTYGGRVVSTFGQPNLYSGFLLLALPFSFHLFLISKKPLRIFIGTSVFLSMIAIFLSESRASIALLFFLFGFYIFKLGKSIKILYRLRVFILLIIAVVFIFILLPKFFMREVIDPLNNKWVARNAPEKRILVWQVAGEQLLSRPFFGYGLESFRWVYKNYFEKSTEVQDKAFQNRKNLVVDRAHNYTLDLLVFSGIGGVVWIFLVFGLLKRAKKEVLFISLLMYVIWVQFQIQSVVHLIYFWVLAAIIDMQKISSSKRKVSI